MKDEYARVGRPDDAGRARRGRDAPPDPALHGAAGRADAAAGRVRLLRRDLRGRWRVALGGAFLALRRAPAAPRRPPQRAARPTCSRSPTSPSLFARWCSTPACRLRARWTADSPAATSAPRFIAGFDRRGHVRADLGGGPRLHRLMSRRTRTTPRPPARRSTSRRRASSRCSTRSGLSWRSSASRRSGRSVVLGAGCCSWSPRCAGSATCGATSTSCRSSTIGPPPRGVRTMTRAPAAGLRR